MSKTPILCYHNIGQVPPEGRLGLLYVDAEKLSHQLWCLRRLGLRGVSMREGFGQLRSHSRAGLVILTFDDGYVDTLTRALPVLKEYGFTATCYVVSEAIGTHNRWDAGVREETPLMSQAQLQQWLAAGMEIGSHSQTHPRLQELDRQAADQEIAGSRATLRATFGISVEHFAYPYGSFDDTSVELVRRAGYSSAVTVISGVARPKDDSYRLPRILVNGEHGWWRLPLQVATPYGDLCGHLRRLRRLHRRSTTPARH